MIITSQHFLDASIVAQKVEENDFVVMLSPVFKHMGEEYQVILDGHHSYHAALACDVEPEYSIASVRSHDVVALLEEGKIEDFLMACYNDGDYYNIVDGWPVW